MNDTDALSSIQERPSPSGRASPRVPGRQSPSLDDYEIIREIGRGGTAIVYEAYHKSLRRKVALKQLPAAAALDPRWQERFHNEVRATSQLSHPNIVLFYELGKEEGTHFYTMQLIDGISLAEVIRRLRQCREGEPPCNNLEADSLHPAFLKLCGRCKCRFACGHAEADNGPHNLTTSPDYHQAVAELIRDAALAVQYAHNQGVLHLDIKPSNILIDTEGKVWVTDFGAARSAPDNSACGTGGRFGTLRYMSPEQMLGDDTLDQRSDVFSLAATMSELLTLERWVLERATIVSPRGATGPLEATSCNPRPLQDILRKATANSRDQRYASASDLADDLQRFLDNQLSARPPHALRRLTFWLSSHKVAAGVSAILCCALLTVVGSHLLSRFEQQPMGKVRGDSDVRIAESANEANGPGRTRQQDANASNTAEEPGETLHADTQVGERPVGQESISQQNLRRAREALDKYVADVTKGTQPRGNDLLQAALDRCQQFMEASENDRESQNDLALAWYRAGNTSAERGMHDDALATYRIAREILAKLVDEHPDVLMYQKDLAGAYNQIGMQLAAVGKFNDARDSYEKAIEISQGLIEKDPAVLIFRRYLANHYCNLGELQLELNEPVEAITSFQKVVQISETVVGMEPANLENLASLAYGCNRLGYAHLLHEDLTEAIASASRAISAYEELLQKKPGFLPYQHMLAGSYNNLGVTRRDMGDLDAAIAAYRKAMTLSENVIAQDPSRDSCRDFLIKHYRNLGIALAEHGEFEEAIVRFRQAVQLQPDDTLARYHLANAYQMQSDEPSAIEEYRTVVTLQADFALAHNNLAWLLAMATNPQLRRPADSVAHATKAVDLAPEHSEAWNTLGVAQYRNGQWDEAIRALTKSVELSEDGSGSPCDLLFLAMAHWQLGQQDESRQWYDKAVIRMNDRQHDDELSRIRAEADMLMGVGTRDAASPPSVSTSIERSKSND